MADGGFDIADILPSGVTLDIPTFKGGRDQLDPEDSDETSRIAAFGRHGECSIDQINN